MALQVLSSVWRLNAAFRGYKQQDPQELLYILQMRMEEELELRRKSRNLTSPSRKLLATFAGLMKGTLLTKVTCSHCQVGSLGVVSVAAPLLRGILPRSCVGACPSRMTPFCIIFPCPLLLSFGGLGFLFWSAANGPRFGLGLICSPECFGNRDTVLRSFARHARRGRGGGGAPLHDLHL